MPEVAILSSRTLTGPNIWAHRPVIQFLIQIGKFEELPSDHLPGFVERLARTLPSLYAHRCSEGREGGFFERLRRGTWMGHILEHVALELQSLAGMECGFGRTRGTGNYGEYWVVVDYKEPAAAEKCMQLARDLLEALADDQPQSFDLMQRLIEIREEAEDLMLGPSAMAIVNAAIRRNIPWMRLDSKSSLVQLGHAANSRRIQAAETSITPNIAVGVASDKELAKELMETLGLPVPKGEIVLTQEEALRATQDIGGPVVVKPADGNQGRAVSVNLTTEDDIKAAFLLASEESAKVIVEEFVTGNDYRLLVVDGNMVAASRRRPAQVTGNGSSTVRELVSALNADPRRGGGHACALTRIRMDGNAELTLRKQHLDWDSVPLAGQVVLLRECSNLSTGGTATDVTDDVHPEVAAAAVLAAQTIGLDIAGVDIVCENIAVPLEEQGGGIVEINAAPGLRMHVQPSQGKPRPVGEAIVDMLFPNGSKGRIPLVAVTGTNGKTTVTRMIAHVFSTMKKYVGMTNTDGIYFNGELRITGDCSGPLSAQAVLRHPCVEVAVLETARGGILRSGLGWDQCSTGVVLNVADDHLGMGGINTREDLARVKRVIAEEVALDGFAVLNAEDPLVAEMVSHCRGKVIYFGSDSRGSVISAHLAAGGRAVYLRDEEIVLAEGFHEIPLVRTCDIPATLDGRIPFQVQNAMAAAAACWSEGLRLHTIRLGLRTFQTDAQLAPGRFNFIEAGDMQVLVDYAHNTHALCALQSAVKQMNFKRTICVLAAPGDRRDTDLAEIGKVAAAGFDIVVVREDSDRRGRPEGEAAGIIAKAVTDTNTSLEVITELQEDKAISRAVNLGRPGDLIVVLVDKVADTARLVEKALEERRQTAMQQPRIFKMPRNRSITTTGTGSAGIAGV